MVLDQYWQQEKFGREAISLHAVFPSQAVVSNVFEMVVFGISERWSNSCFGERVGGACAVNQEKRQEI